MLYDLLAWCEEKHDNVRISGPLGGGLGGRQNDRCCCELLNSCNNKGFAVCPLSSNVVVKVPFHVFAGSARLSPPTRRFFSFALERLERARQYVVGGVGVSSDARGASYGHGKPPKLALFCEVQIPNNRNLRLPSYFSALLWSTLVFFDLLHPREACAYLP